MTVHVSAEMREKICERAREISSVNRPVNWIDITIQAFAEVLSENPIALNPVDAKKIIGPMSVLNETSLAIAIEAFQRHRMFAPPTPTVPECVQEVFSNKYGTIKAIVCSCGFATTYTVLSNDADEIGREHFDTMHEAFRRGEAKGAKR